MRNILFIGGPRHEHRMPIPLDVDPESLTVLSFGEDYYFAAGDLGYRWHPDEKEDQTWIMWHREIRAISIERIFQNMHMKNWGSYVQDHINSLQREADAIRAAQEPHVYSGICMIKYWNQIEGVIRLNWSWLGFEPAEQLAAPIEFKVLTP